MPHIHHHHNFFNYFLNRELSEVYLTVAGRAFAIALIGVFVPIYLFQQGFDIRYIFLFYSIVSAAFALTVFLSAKISTKIGIKHGMLLSMPFLIAYYLLLQFVIPNTLNWIFFLAPIAAGLHSSFFWVNFHTDFARFSSRKFRAEQVAGYQIFCSVLAALGPIIGGFILLKLGFNFLFVLVSVLLFFSTIPLFMSKEMYIPKDFSFRRVNSVIKRVGLKGLSGFVGYALCGCAGLAWVLIMFFILKNYLGVGALTSVGLFVAITSTYFVGKLSDKYNEGIILRIGSSLTALGWFIRSLISTVLQVLGIGIFFGIVAPASAGGTAFDALNYDMAKRKDIAEVIAIREITLHISTALFMFLLFFLANLSLALIFGVVGSFLLIIFSFQKKKV